MEHLHDGFRNLTERMRDTVSATSLAPSLARVQNLPLFKALQRPRRRNLLKAVFRSLGTGSRRPSSAKGSSPASTTTQTGGAQLASLDTLSRRLPPTLREAPCNGVQSALECACASGCKGSSWFAPHRRRSNTSWAMSAVHPCSAVSWQKSYFHVATAWRHPFETTGAMVASMARMSLRRTFSNHSTFFVSTKSVARSVSRMLSRGVAANGRLTFDSSSSDCTAIHGKSVAGGVLAAVVRVGRAVLRSTLLPHRASWDTWSSSNWSELREDLRKENDVRSMSPTWSVRNQLPRVLRTCTCYAAYIECCRK